MSKNNDKLSYGITVLVFGLIFLLDRIGLLAQVPYASKLLSVGAFILVTGIVFIITQPKRTLGWVFTAIGVFLNADFFFGWIQSYSKFLVPAALIIIGLAMVISSKRK